MVIGGEQMSTPLSVAAAKTLRDKKRRRGRRREKLEH
jgi:hypothetical protein